MVIPVAGVGWTEDDVWAAEMKLDELRDAVLDQEKLIDHLEAGESCIQSNKECTRPHMTAASKLRRAQADRFKLLREDEPVHERIAETANLKYALCRVLHRHTVDRRFA